MPEDYTALVAALKGSGIPFAEYDWQTRPTGDYGTVSLDFEAAADYGDDRKVARAFSGSVDLFMHGRDLTKVEAVEEILENTFWSCWSCWRLEGIQHERETGLIHYEWVFEVEG